MSLVFITGMPASGKTFWGRAWAAQHSWAFIDIDEEAENLAGVSIPQIFDSVGEAGFRDIESGLLVQAIAGAGRVNTIISTGGGAAAFGDNMDVMIRAGCVVYLKARTKTILQNLKSAATQVRPLLATYSEASLEELLEKRRTAYERAHIVVDAGKIGEATFAQIIKACTNRRL